jgi:hypothetical protein
MNGSQNPPPTADELKKAAERAEAAATKAENAARRPTVLLIVGFSFALVGAVLAFALKDGDPSVLGVRLQPFGGVLFVAGVLGMVGGAIGSMGSGGGGNSTTVKSIGGLIAVGIGVAAVTTLAIVTLTQFGPEEKDSIVAITSSAFGIISAVVGAYLGIKITSDTAGAATEQAKDAGVAQHLAYVATTERDAATEKAKEVAPQQAAEINAAAIEAGEEEVSRLTVPPVGGRGA